MDGRSSSDSPLGGGRGAWWRGHTGGADWEGQWGERVEGGVGLTVSE